jgi:23S rRNA (cytosine1962-C5)-methyltransferase
LGCESLLFKNDSSARDLEGLPGYVEAATGKLDALARVVEDGFEFQAPLAEGQKTGWFFDQAANRRSLVKYIREGARMLDVFSYVGAWGVRAAHSGAREVLCVDSSAAALELAAANARRNRVHERNGAAFTTVRGDAFDVLEDLASKGSRFDVVVVDPPAFAKRKKELPKALAAYKRLNQLAMRVIAADGILVSCSCSHHVSPEDLQDAIAKAARAADKRLQILEAGGQAPDHPVHPAIPETRYLKAYFCRVSESLK